MPTADDVRRALEKLAQTHVLVGIPSGSGRTEGSNIDNATLAYIHENGSPANNVPARPFLRPGVENSRDQWEPYLRQAAEAAMQGNEGRADRALEAAGKVARDAAKAAIVEGIPPPIKPESMAQRRRHRNLPGLRPAERNKRADQRADYRGFYERYEAGIETKVTAGGVTPLIDTAQMMNAITYVVKKG